MQDKQYRDGASGNYDVFIGTCTFPESSSVSEFPTYVVVPLAKDLGESSASSLGALCDMLCWDVENGKSVTFTEVPLPTESVYRGGREKDMAMLELACSLSEEDMDMPITTGRRGSVLYGRSYDTLSPEDIEELRRLYHSRPEMKRFPDPFAGLPSTN